MNEATIGMDLGDRRHAVCVMDKAGKAIEERTVINDRESIGEWASRYKGATVAMETGTHSPWVSRFLEELGMRVYMANARKLRAISTSDTKSDKEDARMLAWLCRAPMSSMKTRMMFGREGDASPAVRNKGKKRIRQRRFRVVMIVAGYSTGYGSSR